MGIRYRVVILGAALWLVPVASFAQFGGLGSAIKRAITKKAEEDVDKLVRDGVRCALDDAECISRAEQEGKPIVLTDEKGAPILDEDGQPITDPAKAKEATGGGRGWPTYDLAGAPRGFVSAIESEVTSSAPEIARERDAAMTAYSAYYGATSKPLDELAVYRSATHSARAYRSMEEIHQELGEGVEVAQVLTAITGLQYYVLDEGDRQVVAIRGTEPSDIRNWIADLVVRGAVDDVLHLDVHEGFLLATRVIEAGLMSKLDRSRPVHLTGHSLGGSLATLLALHLDRLGYRVSVTTFGAPKITTFDAFAHEPSLHRLDLVRVVNAGDVVYHFPPTMDTTGKRVYAQFGREWTLTDDGECIPTDLRGSLQKSAAMVADSNLPEWSLDEHGMEIYVERLAKTVERLKQTAPASDPE